MANKDMTIEERVGHLDDVCQALEFDIHVSSWLIRLLYKHLNLDVPEFPAGEFDAEEEAQLPRPKKK